MRGVTNQSTIWKLVGGVSAINGLVCFALSSTYDMSFGKLGFGGHLVYVLVCLIVGCIIVWDMRIPVPVVVQVVVLPITFVVSLLLDKLMTRISDVWSMIAYGSLALMSVSMSRRFELGFETGVSVFFLQLFAAQLYEIKWFLLLIALPFFALIFVLRHWPWSGSSANAAGDMENQYSEGQSLLLPTNNQENNPEDSMHHSASNDGQVSEWIISDLDIEQNDEAEGTRFPAEYSYSGEQVEGSSGNNRLTIQNGRMHSSPSPSGEQDEVPSGNDGLTIRNGRMHGSPSGEPHEVSLGNNGLIIRNGRIHNSPSGGQDEVSSGNNRLTVRNHRMHSSTPQQLLRRRISGMRSGIHIISRRVGRWLRPHWSLLSLFFF